MLRALSDDESSSVMECLRTLRVGCGHCGKESGLLACRQCRTVHYCSKECQKKDWNGHKLECVAVKAAKAAGKRETQAPNADSADQFEALMVYTESLVNSSMRELAAEDALHKIVLAQAPLHEMSRHFDELETDQRLRFSCVFSYLLVMHALRHGEVHSKADPRGVVALAERIRTRLQRHFSFNLVPVLVGSEGVLDSLIGGCYHSLGELDRAKTYLERSVQLLDAYAVPPEIATPQWPGALRNLVSIAAAQKDLESLRKWREMALAKYDRGATHRAILLDSALFCHKAIETLRVEAASIVRGHPALRAGGATEEVPALMESLEQRRSLLAVCDADFKSAVDDAKRNDDLPFWSRAAACRTLFLLATARAGDAWELAAELQRVHVCAPRRCHHAAIAHAVVQRGGCVDSGVIAGLHWDYGGVRGLPTTCEALCEEAWSDIRARA